MSKDDAGYEVLQNASGYDAPLRRYGPLDPGRVPATLHHLIPAAEQWGIGDDIMRERVAKTMSESERAYLKAELKRVQLDLYGWLGGPDSNGPRYSDEYLAFSALGMMF
jgi:hypothetical protein